jgi:integrase
MMAILTIGHSRLIVKYLYDNNGRPYFQIRVPDDLREQFGGKRKVSIPLREEDGAPAIQVQRLAANHKAMFKAMRKDPSLSMADQKVAALTLLQKFGLKEGDGEIKLEPWEEGYQYDSQPHLNDFMDYIIEAKREGELTAVQQLAYRALKTKLPTSLSEMLPVYFDHHDKGKDLKYRKKTKHYWDRLLRYAGDISASQFDRQMANGYVVWRSRDDVTRATIIKEINILRAVFTTANGELSLGLPNPFEKIKIPKGVGRASVDREVATKDEIRLVIDTAKKSLDDIRMMAILLACTGCRFSEIVGLRTEDFKLHGDIAYIHITPYGKRSLKTKNSTRLVPLIDLARRALTGYLQKTRADGAVFPRYNNLNEAPSSDAANVVINDWIKSVLDEQKTTYAFRHAFIDLLRDAGVTEDVRTELTGQSRQVMEDRYGLGYSLERKLGAIRDAYSWL